jgi:hypothetical protein
LIIAQNSFFYSNLSIKIVIKLSNELIPGDDLIDIEYHPDEMHLSPYSSATRIIELIQAYISAQDVRQSSKNTCQRNFKQYFSWIKRKGYDLSQVARQQIPEYKTDLLNSGLSALTVGSYISPGRRFYELCESE